MMILSCTVLPVIIVYLTRGKIHVVQCKGLFTGNKILPVIVIRTIVFCIEILSFCPFITLNA